MMENSAKSAVRSPPYLETTENARLVVPPKSEKGSRKKATPMKTRPPRWRRQLYSRKNVPPRRQAKRNDLKRMLHERRKDSTTTADRAMSQ